MISFSYIGFQKNLSQQLKRLRYDIQTKRKKLKMKTKIAAALSVMAVLLIAIVPAHAEVIYNDTNTWFVLVPDNSCTQEPVLAIAPNMHIVVARTEDNDGKIHFKYHLDWDDLGLGFGLGDPGNIYAVLPGTRNISAKFEPSEDPFVVNGTLNILLYNLNTQTLCVVHVNGHITVNANGDTTAEFRNVVGTEIPIP